MILAGDIGGTNTRLALFDGGTAPLRIEKYRTAGESLVQILRRFLGREATKLRGACFGVAGTVANNSVAGVNLPWSVDASELQAALDARVWIVNDLHANARGVEVLERSDFATLNAGEAVADGNRAVVSAGTGLGEAALLWTGAGYQAIATEGGHADFAARSDVEVDLYRYLHAEFGHVSYERVCSGTGLVNIYRFLAGDDRDAATITQEALADRSSVSSRALDVFVAIYGAHAGNVALEFMATGGVFLGGGIAPKIVARLREGGFSRAFADKGRFRPLLERVPVHVILNDHAALLGAARIAAERSLVQDPTT